MPDGPAPTIATRLGSPIPASYGRGSAGDRQSTPRPDARVEVVTDHVLAFVDAVAEDPQINLHSLIVRDPSGVQVEAYWGPYVPDDRQLVYSASKTIMATAAGFALAAVSYTHLTLPTILRV